MIIPLSLVYIPPLTNPRGPNGMKAFPRIYPSARAYTGTHIFPIFAKIGTQMLSRLGRVPTEPFLDLQAL